MFSKTNVDRFIPKSKIYILQQQGDNSDNWSNNNFQNTKSKATNLKVHMIDCGKKCTSREMKTNIQHHADKNVSNHLQWGKNPKSIHKT